jgi:hypothetical protein
VRVFHAVGSASPFRGMKMMRERREQTVRSVPLPGSSALLTAVAFTLSVIIVMIGGTETAWADRITNRQAIAFLNEQRVSSGLPSVQFSPKLSQGCAAHDRYMTLNGFGHGEIPGRPGYSPEGAGEGEYGGSEVLHWGGYGYGPDGVNPFENAPIHLYLMLEPTVSSVGYHAGNFVCARMRGGGPGGGTGPQFYSYPGPGATGVWHSQQAAESPYIPQQLVGIPEDKKTGPNILLFSTGAGRNLKATSFSLTGPDGAVPAKLVVESTSNKIGNGRWFSGGGVLIPVNPLRPRSNYEVTIDWVNDSRKTFKQSFGFTTEGLDAYPKVTPFKNSGARFESSSKGPALITVERRHDGSKRTYALQGPGVIRDSKLPAGYWRYCWEQKAEGRYDESRGCGSWRRYAADSGFRVTRGRGGRFRIDPGASEGRPVKVVIEKKRRRCWINPYTGRDCGMVWIRTKRLTIFASDGLVPKLRMKRRTRVSFSLDKFDREGIPYGYKFLSFRRGKP